LILEVNSSPGLEGIESATGKNIAGRIISFVERKAIETTNNPRNSHNLTRNA
jgi:ribosomal protein S6--L-glutamate ligase